MTPWFSGYLDFRVPDGLNIRISGHPEAGYLMSERTVSEAEQAPSRMFDWTRDGMCPITHQGRNGTI